MRGAHSAGVLRELSLANLPDFDIICGSSAGACTVAFWVAKQPHLMEHIWRDYVHAGRLIKYRRLIMPGPILDLEYLLEDVFAKREPLDTSKILSSSTDFFIAATHCLTGKAHYFHNKDSMNVLKALRAGAAMPLAHPLPFWNHGEPYADGGIASSIPVQKALSEGCDVIWAVLTRPRGYRKKRLSKIPWPRWIYQKYPPLAHALMERHIVYNRQLDLLDELERQGRAFIIRPGTDLPVSRLTRKYRKIHAAIEQGRRDAASFLANIDLSENNP